MAEARPCNPADYYDPVTWKRFLETADKHETPALILDLNLVAAAYDALQAAFRFVHVYYAVKANPAPEITCLLRDRGSCFDIASPWELNAVLACGVEASRISVGTTIKKLKDIREYYQKGVRIFATDSEEDLLKLAIGAPGANVYVRMLTDGSATAEWPLSRKFGCDTEMAMWLLIRAKQLGLHPYGVSFHVGSQQRDIGCWEAAINRVAEIFRRLKETEGIQLEMVNLGGGWPGHYMTYVSPIAEYGSRIENYLKRAFGENNMPIVMVEPGRSLVADAGIVVSEIMMTARKSLDKEADKWVFADCGKFGGLYEADDAGIKYPVWLGDSKSDELEEVVIAGPTCDSVDILYEKFKYRLPVDISSGDKIYWLSAGAYTYSTSSVGFNGFQPLRCYFTGGPVNLAPPLSLETEPLSTSANSSAIATVATEGLPELVGLSA